MINDIGIIEAWKVCYFSFLLQTLIFSDSQRILTYEIEIVDDVIPEGNESFVVLLNNPSAGLELGNITMATVTIASNDDAHGRLSFNNELLIEIDEPESFKYVPTCSLFFPIFVFK